MKTTTLLSSIIGILYVIAWIYIFYTLMWPTLPWLGVALAVFMFGSWYAIYRTLQRYFG